ncbi:MAG TPA: ATP-binding protein, partial [Elusimicrobiota bacterium]|nr:ATP-binding protein [Elusimicrobiota bacterium]
GRSEDDLLRSNAFDLRPREEAVASIQKDRQALQDGKPIDVPEQPLQVPGQDERLLRTQKIPVFDDWGRPAFLLTISEDITQRKQAEKMLELSRDAAVESARLKSEFIRNMSHEIRTPLSVVIGMTDLLLDTTLGAEQRRFASTIRRAAEGLLGLSKSILDFSKIESGAFALETRELDVRKIVDEIAAMLRPQAKAKSVNLATLVDGAVPAVVRGDPTRLRQVLTHIVGNAVKFTARGDVIVRVLQRRESDAQSWLHFRVSDTGIGIHADYQKELFQPFRQGDGSRTRRYGGTGLGLAVSKRIVDLMGGEIGFDSIPDQGSTFWWTIPFNKRHVEGPVVDGPSPNWARSRVLVVDENETVRQILQEQLQTWALASETASGGQTALEALRHEQQAGRAFPIVILDMHLPDMDAVAFARAVRQDATLSGTKLLVMTSPDSPLEPATSASLGFSGWVAKPPAPEDLYERLATLIEPPHLPHKHAA